MAIQSGREGSDVEDAMLATLVEIHRRTRQRERGDDGDRGDPRARIVAHFERRGQRLRGERLVTAELIDRLFAAREAIPPSLPQQEVRIEGAAGREAAGRLRVSNRSTRRARFDLVTGDLVDGERRPEVRFEPSGGELDPGASALVRVVADLRRFAAGERGTVPVECRWREGRDRAWLVVVAHADRGARP
jgi:hypothetical protein